MVVSSFPFFSQLVAALASPCPLTSLLAGFFFFPTTVSPLQTYPHSGADSPILSPFVYLPHFFPHPPPPGEINNDQVHISGFIFRVVPSLVWHLFCPFVLCLWSHCWQVICVVVGMDNSERSPHMFSPSLMDLASLIRNTVASSPRSGADGSLPYGLPLSFSPPARRPKVYLIGHEFQLTRFSPFTSKFFSSFPSTPFFKMSGPEATFSPFRSSGGFRESSPSESHQPHLVNCSFPPHTGVQDPSPSI